MACDATLQAALLEVTGKSTCPSDWPPNGNKVFSNMCRRFADVSPAVVVQLMIEHGYHGGKVAAEIQNDLQVERQRAKAEVELKDTLLKLTGAESYPSGWPASGVAMFQRLCQNFQDLTAEAVVRVMIQEQYIDDPVNMNVTGKLLELRSAEQERAAAEQERIEKSRSAISAVMWQADVDGDGRMNLTEMQALLKSLDFEDGEAGAEGVFASIDTNSSGFVEYDELVDWVYRSGVNMTVPELTISVYSASGENVFGPAPVKSDMTIEELIECCREAVSQPAYKLKLTHEGKVLSKMEKLGFLRIPDGAILTIIVVDIPTPSVGQLREGRKIKWFQDPGPRDYGEGTHSRNYYEWPRDSGIYWCWESTWGGSHEPDHDEVRGPLDKATVDSTNSY